MSQKDQILAYLIAGNRINKITAIQKFNCYVLFARMKDIHDDIRNDIIKGYEYCSNPVKEHHNACEYWLKPLQKQTELF